MQKSLLEEVLVSVDIGCYDHHVAIGLSDGELLEEFKIDHTRDGFNHFFAKIEHHQHAHQLPVSIAMEGFNGHARPLDKMVRARNYRLFNINNLKLARYKEVFRGQLKRIVSMPARAWNSFRFGDTYLKERILYRKSIPPQLRMNSLNVLVVDVDAWLMSG